MKRVYIKAMSRQTILFCIYVSFLLVFSVLPAQEDPSRSMAELEKQLTSAKADEKWKILNRLVSRAGNTQPRRMLDYSRRALELAQSLGDSAKAAESGKDMGIACIYLGEYRRALAVTRAALELAKKSKLRDLIPICHNNMGVSYRYLAEYSLALDQYKQALLGFRETGSEGIVAVTLSNIGVIHYYLGERDKAMTYYTRSLEIHRRLKNASGEAALLNQIAVIYDDEEQYDKALDFYQKSLALYEDIKDPRGIVDPLNNIGIIHYRHFHDYSRAEAEFRRVLQLRRSMDDVYGESVSLNNLGNVFLSQGKLHEALDHYQRSLTLKKKIGNRRELTDTLRDMGEVYRRLGNSRLAMQYLQESLDLAVEIGAEKEEMNAHLDLSRIHDKAGKPASALRHYRRYHELSMKQRGIELSRISKEMQARFESAQKERKIAELTSYQNRQTRVRDLLLFSLAMLLLILLLVYNRFRLRRMAHTRQTELMEKVQRQKEHLEALNQVLERKNREFYRNAIMDSLTGIYNRAYLDDSMTREIRRCRRREHPISLIMMDIDHFKRVNDAHGHLTGDRVLKLMAERIRSQIRGEDILGRYGGEEFLLILPGVTGANTAAVAEKIRRAVAEEPFAFEDTSTSLTLSLGCATMQPGQEVSAMELLKASDEALYCSKRDGRNRVSTA